MSKCYIVYRSSGTYDDYCETPICVFLDSETANSFVRAATNEAERLNAISYDEFNKLKLTNKYDEDFRHRDSGYDVNELPICPSF